MYENPQGWLYHQQGEFQQLPDVLLSQTKGSVDAGGVVGADTGQWLAALSQKVGCAFLICVGDKL